MLEFGAFLFLRQRENNVAPFPPISVEPEFRNRNGSAPAPVRFCRAGFYFDGGHGQKVEIFFATDNPADEFFKNNPGGDGRAGIFQ